MKYNTSALLASIAVCIALSGLVVANAFLFRTTVTQEVTTPPAIADDSPIATRTTEYGVFLPLAYNEESSGTLGVNKPASKLYLINIGFYLIIIFAFSFTTYILALERSLKK